ncbi:MAG: hypothetical protein QOD28_3449 [Acidobacteriota bacterium]|nr:hypothetical protein [Acidobacteriota bacterium]
MPIDLYPKEALLTAVRTARKPIAFLVGSPLSTDSGGGVPGVAPVIELVRDEIRARAGSELPRFEDAIQGKFSGDAYQAAMKWLQGNFTQDAVNQVVRAAVLLARKDGTAADFDCDGAVCDWHLPAGTQQLAALVCQDREHFPGPILTTNFDPLLSLAIESFGGRPHLRVIQSDGGLGLDVKRTGEIEVVHLHGFWRDADTLHTPAQLTSARPRLKDSLKEILRQRTLIVAAYGGWDDVFATALAEIVMDEATQVNVLWCFRDANPDEVERNNRRLVDRVQPALTRGRFVAYGGIDCHSIFSEIAGAMPAAAVPVVSAGAARPPIAGWQVIDSALLAALPPLRPEEVVRYFDGAVPTWRHAVSGAIPRRQEVAELGTRIAKVHSAKAACILQLIRAAGGEGKSTLLLQAAADAAHTGDWTVLWRTSPTEGLPPEQVAKLDPSQQWLIVADAAENLVHDLADSASRLDAGQTNVHFLVAARDADWRNAKGDQQPWDEWLTQQPDLILRDISRDDADKIVRAWEKCGPDGLRELAARDSTASRVAALQHAIRDAALDQWQKKRGRNPTDGSFFGGLLAVRFGQKGLQAHVRGFLTRLKDVPAEEGSGNLFDALVYVAACHGTGIPGISEIILADLVGVTRDWIQSRIVRPLGEEAAAVQSAGHVFTRHSKVAAAILIEAEQTFGIDLSEVWTQLIRQTTQTGREPGMRVGPTFSPIVHAGPRLQRALPPQLSEDRRKAIAIAAAEAAKKYQFEWLGCVDSLARTYRNAGDVEAAVCLFRTSLSEARLKVDYNQVIRAYWYEWGVCEGNRGTEREHVLANTWIGGLALSDSLSPAPITSKDIKLICAGLAVVFIKLAQHHFGCPYARGIRAAAYLGRFGGNDPRAIGYFDKSDQHADKLKTPRPKDVAEAITWLTAGVAQAGRELQDSFLAGLAKPSEISFARFRRSLSSRRKP